MTTINTVKALLVASILGLSTLASAAQYEIKVTGNFVKDPSYSSSFNVTADSQPVTFKVVVDDTLGGTMVIPGGTPLTSSGINFAQDITLISASAIVSSEFAIGNGAWTKADLVETSLGATGSTYHILLDGRLNSGSVSQAKLTLDKTGVGFVSAGQFNCTPVCSIIGVGETSDYSNGSPGALDSVSATRTTINQSPACTGIDSLRAKIEALGLTPAVKELMLAKADLNARNVAGAKQHVKNFITLVKAVRGTTLKAATADLLILLGNALLLIIK